MRLERPIKPLAGPWVDVVRRGADVLLLTAGPATLWAETAAEALSAKGIEATVAGVRRVHPLDGEAIRGLVADHPAVVTVEDNALAGGFGSAILEFMSAEGLCRPIARLGLPDAFVCQGSLELLRRDVGLTPDGHRRGGRAAGPQLVRRCL